MQSIDKTPTQNMYKTSFEIHGSKTNESTVDISSSPQLYLYIYLFFASTESLNTRVLYTAPTAVYRIRMCTLHRCHHRRITIM